MLSACGLTFCARKRFLRAAASALLAASAPALLPQAGGPQIDFPTVLYGAAYYNEYMPQDSPNALNERLEKDVALMKAAGLNVVRMGESTWSLWEPEDGRFEYAWMDHIVDAMGNVWSVAVLQTKNSMTGGLRKCIRPFGEQMLWAHDGMRCALVLTSFTASKACSPSQVSRAPGSTVFAISSFASRPGRFVVPIVAIPSTGMLMVLHSDGSRESGGGRWWRPTRQGIPGCDSSRR